MKILQIGVAAAALSFGVANAQDAQPGDAPEQLPGADMAPADEAASTGEAPAEAEADSGDAPEVGDGESYSVRLREIQTQLDELKENVFRSKSRLYLLREQILEDSVGTAQAVITHVDELGRNYEIEEIRYSLDGAPIYSSSAADGDINDVDELELFAGQVQPGTHTLAVQMRLRGVRRGIFSYTTEYVFDVATTHTFSVDGGERIDIDATGFRAGKSSEHFEERPDVRFVEERVAVQGVAEADADQPADSGTGDE